MNWKLFIGESIQKMDKMLLNADSNFIRRNYPYRRNFVYDLKRTQTKPKVIFDIGAFVGDVALEFSQFFPQADIYAFEPVTHSYNTLLVNTKNKANIHCFKNAIGDVAGNVEVPVYTDLTITTLKEVKYDVPPITTEKIDVIRLDDFLKEKQISQIDIIKVDVEGFEMQVLNGLGSFTDKVNCIVIEVGYQRGPEKTHFADVDRYMEQQGFRLFNIYELNPKYNDRTTLFYSNNVYIR